MKVKSVPNRWIYEDGLRLDCGPYMSGAMEARKILEELSLPKSKLCELTAGHDGGIYNGPKFRRNYVESKEHGVPFLGSSSILSADLSNLPLLSKKDAYSRKLSYLEVKEGMTLITCSGTIGRMAYARSDMEGMWSSQHMLKVVPDRSKILPGYLYAYLSSKFGVPLITSGTYGAIIQHIEPHHIAELPVPRFDAITEEEIHRLILQYSRAISSFSHLMREATKKLFRLCDLKETDDFDWHLDKNHLGWGVKLVTSESLRSMNFDPRAESIIASIKSKNYSPLGSLCNPQWFKGKIFFKRIDADSEHGCILLGQRNAFHMHPEGRCISVKSIDGLGLQVPPRTTLVPSHGTLGEHELYCRALYVTESTSEYAFSGDFFRCIPDSKKIPPGYLFAFLRSRTAFRLLRSISIGGKQQEQHPEMMWRLPIPRLDADTEEDIASLVDRAAASYDQALADNNRAQILLEKAMREAV
ncbi:MAG: restriction endonuclease subunit S [Cyanobacteria bacterium P01_D01_bin.1]